MLDSLFADLLHPTSLPAGTVGARLLVAALLGALIGIDREWRNDSAGLRTHMLTALAAAAFTLITIELVRDTSLRAEAVRADPVRIIDAVTAGIAFLAAGTIIRGERGVKGLTTGAGMWLAGSLGVASGLGYWLIATIATAIGLVIVVVLRRFEAKIKRKPDDENAFEREHVNLPRAAPARASGRPRA